MTSKTENPNRRRKWLIIGGGLLGLLVVGWLVLTSGPVVKALVLPRVAAALQADLTVGELRLSPFSGIDLKDVTLTPIGGQPFAEIAGVKVRYQLFKLLGGAIAVGEIELNQPRFTIRQRADGGSDLTDWLAKLKGGETELVEEPASSEPLQLQIGKVTIRDGSVRYEIEGADGAKQTATINSLEVAVDQVRNGRPTEAKLTASLGVESRDATGALVDSLRAGLDLSSSVALDAGLAPGQVDTRLRLDVREATGRFAQGAELSAQLTARGSLPQLDEFALVFQQRATEVGRVQVTGGYDPAAGAGAFDLTIAKLPPIVLELAALQTGLTFELANFAGTNRVVIAAAGDSINASGRLSLEQFAAGNAAGSTPSLDVSLNYDTAVEFAASRALIRQFELIARQDGRALVDARVTQPFHFAWAGQPGSEEGSSFALKLEQLRLSDWRAFSGELPLDGLLGVEANIDSRELGQQLAFRARAALTEVSTGSVPAQTGRELVALIATGQVSLASVSAEMLTTVNADLPALAALAGELPLKLQTGALNYQSSVSYSAAATKLSGSLNVTNLTGDLAGVALRQLEVVLPHQVSLQGDTLAWQLTEAGVTEAGQSVLQLVSSGQLDTRHTTGHVALSVPMINERLVNPFLSVYTPPQKFRSATASLALHGELRAGGLQDWSLTSQSTNVVVVGTNDVPLAPMLGTHASLNVAFHPENGTVSLKHWDAQVFAGGKPSGELSATAEIRLQEGLAKVNARLSGVNEHTLQPLAPLLVGDRTIERANASAELELDYDQSRPSQARASFDLRDFAVRDAQGALPDLPRELGLNLRAAIASNRLDLTEGRARMTPTAGLSNEVSLTGWVDFARTDALSGDLAIRSPGVDLTPLYALMERGGGDTNPPPTADPLGTPEAPATGIFPLPVSRFTVAADFRQLRLRELLITNWMTQATVRSNAVELGLFSLRLNGSPINARLQATNEAGATRFELAAEVERLPTGPLARTFSPGWLGTAESDLFAAVRLGGTARPGQSLLAVANGDIHFGLTNGNFQFLSPRWQNTLRPVGLLLQTPALFSSPITWAYQRSHFTNQTLTLDQFTVMSEAYLLDVNATIPLTEDFTSSAIPRTPVNLHLSRNLVTQLGFLKGTDTNQTARYVELPVFAHLGGTFADPKVETDKLKLTGLAVGKAGDFVGGTAGDVLRKAGGLTEGLGGILSGRKLAGTEKEDANPVSRGIEGVFNVVGGVLGGTGRAVEQGTGVVTGTRTVEADVLATKVKPFDWPRVFTNAPNARTAPQ